LHLVVVAALGRGAVATRDYAALGGGSRAIAPGLAGIARAHQLVVVHAGGMRSIEVDAQPDLQAARDAGLVGHLLARELRNALPATTVTSLLAQAIVHCEDPAGPSGAVRLCRLIEMPLLVELADRDDRVTCVGCVPVQQAASALLAGGDLRLDHDQLAATLAVELRADILLLLTDVAAVHPQWPATSDRIACFEARDAVPASLDAATIGGKLGAACRFACTPGTFAVIGAADDAEGLVAGRSGTCVARSR
jgi:carbamate kinase